MNSSAIQPWWTFVLRGLVALVFGALALALPGITLLSLVALFAAYALLGGAASIFGAVKRAGDDDRWLPLLLGVVSLGAGAIALIHPGLTALVLVLLIGAHALVTGTLDIANAIRLRKAIRGEWLLALSGLVSIVFGALVFVFPGAGALALVWLIGLYALLSGSILIILGARLWKLNKAPYRGEERRVNPERRTSAAH